MKIYVITSDKRYWLLNGFMYQWSKYGCGLPVTIAGFSQPDFPLYDGFDFYSIGDFSDYPVEKWSNALVKLLRDAQDEQILLMLEDYWLTRRVDIEAIRVCSDMMTIVPNILRFDMTTDRLYAEKIFDVGSYSRLDIIESSHENSYQLSTQAAIWSKSKFLDILIENENPWEVELRGSERIRERFQELRILGTRQCPIRYQIMVRNGKFEKAGNWMFPPKQISEQDWVDLLEKHPEYREL